jgi:hypothetical protein
MPSFQVPQEGPELKYRKPCGQINEPIPSWFIEAAPAAVSAWL